VMCWDVGVAIGEYYSSGSAGSLKILLLYSANVLRFSADMSLSFYLSIFQKFFGLYFIISGSYFCSFALFRAQHCLYSLYAFYAGMLEFPYFLLHYLLCRFAVLHSSLYHGAMCFSHLLGFFLAVISVLVITPAATASSIRNCSIFSALLSLSSLNFSSISLNTFINSLVDVCSLQIRALVLYSSSYSP
jgi:hypothetical protein